MITIRCSELPRVLACPGSLVRDEDAILVDEASDAADLGTAAHVALQEVVRVGSPDYDAINDIAAEHGADPDDVRVLAAMGAKLWQAVKDEFPFAQSEIKLSAHIGGGVTLTGTADIIAARGRVGRVADWKTGRVDSSYRDQVLGYDALLLLDNAELDAATGSILWVRDGDAEHYTMTRADLAAWMAMVVERVTSWRGVYTTGSHCTFCPLRATCKARFAVARRDAAAMLGLDAPVDVTMLSAEDALRLYDAASRAEKMAAQVREAVRARLEAGPIEAVGERLELKLATARELDPAAAWSVLQAAGFDDADFAAAMDLRVGRVEKIVAAKAGRGKGAAAVRDIGEKLTAAKAITINEKTTINRRRA